MFDSGLRSILVATDLTEGSEDVMGMAAALARRVGAELHAVHAVEKDGPRFGHHGFELVAQHRVLRERRAALGYQLHRAVPEDVHIGSRKLEHQIAHVAIVRRAQEVGADLIVMGPHRARVPGSHLLGTTAQRVVREASVPCLVGRTELPWPLKKILLPVGRDDIGRGLLLTVPRWIAALVREPTGSSHDLEPSDVRVLHVVRSLDEWRDFSSEFSRAICAVEEDPWIARHLRLRRAVAWSRSAGEEIVRLASSNETDLIAMGVGAEASLVKAALRSVSAVVLRYSETPVLLFPPQACERNHSVADVIPFPVHIGIQ